MIAATHMLVEHDRPAQVIYVGEDYRWRFDAEPGDTIIVVMDPTGDPIDRCNHMGGEPVVNPFTTLLTCEAVDF